MHVPIARPDLSGREEEYVLDAVRSGWISSSGKYLERFEQHYAELCGAKIAVAVANGTVALHLALAALGVRPGDEVLVPDLTYVAPANAVRYLGGEPVLVDVDPATWCLDPAGLEAVITPRTKGIIAVDLYGHPADMDAVLSVAAIHGLWVVEDAAEAHLARYKDRVVGSLADLTTFSFYGNKIFTCGEGGAITLNNERLAMTVRTLRNQGMDPRRRYFFPVTGYNFRLTNVAAAILCAQVERYEVQLAKRRGLFKLYRSGLSGIPGLEFQPAARWAEPSPWLFSVLVDAQRYGRSRDEVAARLLETGVETRPFFIPLHSLPPFAGAARGRGGAWPVSDRLGEVGLNLPTFVGLEEEQVAKICREIRLFQGGRQREARAQ
jgi:perosamine synthetase